MNTKMSGIMVVIVLLAALIVPDRPISTNSAAQWMPPHPDLLKRFQKGEAPLPPQLADPGWAARQGINRLSPRAFSWKGTVYALAVPTRFSDQAATVAPVFFDTLLFAPVVPGAGSVRDYFNEISYNQVDFQTLNPPGALGWKLAPAAMATYVANNYCFGAYPNNCQKLAEDMVDALNPSVNYAQYDNNNDGFAEPIIIIHAGSGAEWTGNSTDIWSHTWTLATPRFYDGVTIDRYIIVPEFWAVVSAGSSDMTIGVYAHEMGHGFWSLPDLYDTNYTSLGVGDWSLMGYGSWNGVFGNLPAWPDAWSRIQMGFATAIPIISNQTGVPVQLAYNGLPNTIYKLTSVWMGSQEYFLVENRFPVAGVYDFGLPGGGLLIWHVDEQMWATGNDNDYECTVFPHALCSDTQHYLVALEQADGLMHLENNVNTGDGSDPFPGSIGRLFFNNNGVPESSSYYGTLGINSCIVVINISSPGPLMVADMRVNCVELPTNLSATPASGTQIDLSWTDNSSDESGFMLFKSPDGISNWGPLGVTTPNITQFSALGLTCGTPYYYRVQAYRAIDNQVSNFSNITSAIPPCAPLAPSGLAATPISSTRIDLAWVDNSSDEDGFKIQRSPDGISSWSQIGTSSADTPVYLDTTVSCGNTYHYRVRAYNLGGNSATSNTAPASTPACPPAAPANLSATPDFLLKEIRLAWIDMSNNETGFKVEHSLDGTTGWAVIADLPAGTQAYADSNITYNTPYYYRVKAYHTTGNSSYSNTANAVITAYRIFAPAISR